MTSYRNRNHIGVVWIEDKAGICTFWWTIL